MKSSEGFQIAFDNQVTVFVDWNSYEEMSAKVSASHKINGNVVSIISQNLLDLREICEYIIEYRNLDENLALDEAIQHLEYMLERPEDYSGTVEYRDQDADV